MGWGCDVGTDGAGDIKRHGSDGEIDDGVGAPPDHHLKRAGAGYGRSSVDDCAHDGHVSCRYLECFVDVSWMPTAVTSIEASPEGQAPPSFSFAIEL